MLQPTLTQTQSVAAGTGVVVSDTVTLPSETSSLAAGTYYLVIVTNANGSTNASATLSVFQGTPVITWASPAPITYPSPLGTNQLDATASVPGVCVAVGTHQRVPSGASVTPSRFWGPPATPSRVTPCGPPPVVVHSKIPRAVTVFVDLGHSQTEP